MALLQKRGRTVLVRDVPDGNIANRLVKRLAPLYDNNVVYEHMAPKGGLCVFRYREDERWMTTAFERHSNVGAIIVAAPNDDIPEELFQSVSYVFDRCYMAWLQNEYKMHTHLSSSSCIVSRYVGYSTADVWSCDLWDLTAPDALCLRHRLTELVCRRVLRHFT